MSLKISPTGHSFSDILPGIFTTLTEVQVTLDGVTTNLTDPAWRGVSWGCFVFAKGSGALSFRVQSFISGFWSLGLQVLP